MVFAWLIATQVLATCVGPPYQRPDAMLPPVYPDASATPASAVSIGDLGWWQVFKDPQLQKLLRTAVAQNQDVLVAAQRIQQAMQALTIAHAGAFPQINLVVTAPYQQTNGQISATTPKSTFVPTGLLTLSYEVDLFGKVSSATAAARANVLASEFARETVLSTVVTSVATIYFQILELDQELAISKSTLKARKESLELVTARYEGGIGNLQDVRQSQELVAQIEAAIPVLQRTIVQAENSLNILIGGYPGHVQRGLGINEQVALPDVPATGVPSSLIERRPDIKQAEAVLISANAQIGEAKALLFPQFNISASVAASSVQANGVAVQSLLGRPATTTLGQGYISIIPQIVQQIFNAGAAHANVGITEAGKEAATLQYIQTIHQDVGDVSNALVAYDQNRKAEAAQARAAAAAVDSTRLANLRYDGGITSYLEVLVSEQQSYAAELTLVQSEYEERQAVVQLYKALGGGWQSEPQTADESVPRK